MAQALWYVAPDRAQLRDEALPAPAAGELRIRALYGALSRGTERLVASGRVPASEFARMRAPFMSGDFPFPVKYGYSVVGRVEEGADRGRTVFVLHPHQSEFVVPQAAVVPVPATVPPARAVLAANMETALNAVWDAPGPADRIAVVGGGVVGLLVARLCAGIPGAEVTVVDIAAGREGPARSLGAAFATPGRHREIATSSFTPAAAVRGSPAPWRLPDREATVVELSWYGERDVAVPLGRSFHSRRLRLVSSQVGQVAPSRRPRWTHARRLAAALALLADPALDALLAEPIAFADLPQRLPALLAEDADARCPLIRYP